MNGRADTGQGSKPWKCAPGRRARPPPSGRMGGGARGPAPIPEGDPMATMIKLRLPAAGRAFADVQALPGLAGLTLDPKFGLVCLSPRESLYAVRSDAVADLDRRRRLSPEILGAYGDVRISPT